MSGERCYPRSRVASVIVWLLDRLPDSVRAQVLDSYWSPTDLELVRLRAKRWSALFGDAMREDRKVRD